MNFHQLDTPQQLLKMLNALRMDLVEITLLAGSTLGTKLFPKRYAEFDYIVWQELPGALVFLKDNKKSMKLKRLFDKGFSKILKNGVYVKTLERYWGKKNIPRAVLPGKVKSFGVERFDFRKFKVLPQ